MSAVPGSPVSAGDIDDEFFDAADDDFSSAGALSQGIITRQLKAKQLRHCIARV